MTNGPPHAALADEIVTAAVRLTRTLRALTRSGKLTGPEISALAAIVHSGRIRARDLAHLEEVSQPAVSKVVAGLEAKGLVRRALDPQDARALWITATANGAKLLRAGHSARIAPLARAIALLTEEERAILSDAARLVDRLAAEIRDRSE